MTVIRFVAILAILGLGGHLEAPAWAGDTADVSAALRTAISPKDPARPLAPEQTALAKGNFLIAKRSLHGPFFSRTVILLLDYSASGALGLVLNRPLPTTLGELLPEFKKRTDRQDAVYLGGPVESEKIAFLIRSAEAPPESISVLTDIYVTGSTTVLEEVIRNETPPEHFRAYIGYAGWGPGQLDHEVNRGSWYIGKPVTEAIFDPSPKDLWVRMVMEYEGIQVRKPNLSRYARALKKDDPKVAAELSDFGEITALMTTMTHHVP